MEKLPILRSDFPFQPSHRPFYFGWWVLLGATLTQVLSSPGQTAGVSPFIEPLIAVTGLSRLDLSNAYLIGTTVSAICLIGLGRLIDLYGTRLTNLLAGIAMGVVLLVMSQIDHILGVVQGALGNATTVAQLASLLTVAGGFFFLRFVGQGAMTLVGQTAVPRWFVRRRGLATGVGGLVGALLVPLAPQLLNALINLFEWRGAWIAAAGIVVVANTLVVLFLWRDSPSACGLPNDEQPTEETDQTPRDEIGSTRAEAIRTLGFWVVALTGACFGLILTAIAFHIVDLGARRGLDEAASLAWFIPMAWTATTVGFGANVLADRMSYRAFLPIYQIMLVAGGLCLTYAETRWGFYLSSFLMGLALAMIGPVNVTTFPRWFGTLNLGSILSVNWAGTVLGSAIGPSLFSLLLSPTIGYRHSLLASISLLPILFMLTFFIKQPLKARPS